tara:strand:+ start:38 stop:337 length:300 start_codon:yes stop_codon:yes gene_type:complete
MDYITKHEGYEYAAMVTATVFLLPQLYAGYRSKSLKDVSAASLWMLLIASFLWALYMFEKELYHFAGTTVFVGMNALWILLMKFQYYRNRVNDHLATML